MTPAPHRLRHALLLALFSSAPMGCATEVTFCQVEGAKYENADGTLTVWVNPILYVRIYQDELFETASYRVTVLNGNEVVFPTAPVRFLNYTVDPAGGPLCFAERPAMGGQALTGVRIPRSFTRTERLALSVKVDMTDTSGTSRTFTLPVERIRYVQQDMPSFSCAATRCSR